MGTVAMARKGDPHSATAQFFINTVNNTGLDHRDKSQGGYGFEYLRFVREKQEGDKEDQPTGPWRPAAGTFEGWPEVGAHPSFFP